MPVVLDGDRISRSLARITHEIVERNRGVDELAFVGIRRRGVPLARRRRERRFQGKVSGRRSSGLRSGEIRGQPGAQMVFEERPHVGGRHFFDQLAAERVSEERPCRLVLSYCV